MNAGRLGPGPGAYMLPPCTGEKKHDVRKYKSPAYSLRPPDNFAFKRYGPGPAAYQVDKFNERGPSGAPHYTMRPYTQLIEKARSPGPGAHSPELVPTMTGRRPPKYSMALRCDYAEKSRSPGPTYQLPGQLGKVPNKLSAPAYTMRKPCMVPEKYRSPGPAAYDAANLNNFKTQNPGYTCVTTAVPPTDKTRNPGPAGYLPTYVRGRNFPKYSFGIRHGDRAPPMFTPGDNFPCS